MAWNVRNIAGISLLSVVGLPTTAPAQDMPVREPAFRLPALTIGSAVSRIDDAETLLASVSVQRFVGRHLVVEGEGSRWRGSTIRVFDSQAFGPPSQPGLSGTRTARRDRSGWAIGANLLFRTLPRRVSWFAGGGVLLAKSREADSLTVEGCVPPPALPTACVSGEFADSRQTRDVAYRVVTGVDVRIAGPLLAYGLVEFTTAGQMFGRLGGGIRVTTFTRDAARAEDRRIERLAESGVPRMPVARAVGRKVQVWLASGARRTGVLLNLTDTEVMLRESSGAPQRYPLERVRLVEATRNTPLIAGLVGLAAGAATGLGFAFSCGSDFGECLAAAVVLGSVGGAGAAAIGALIDRERAPSNVVWIRKTRTIGIAPILSQKTVGAAAAIRW